MNGKKSILVCLVVVSVIFVGIKLAKQRPRTVRAKSLTISKAWWRKHSSPSAAGGSHALYASIS